MRKIVFRGKKINSNGEWGYGDMRRYGGNTWIFPLNRDAAYDADMVDPETVGEFTGLTDKNDKQIYEGDIVELSLGRYKVVYDRFGCVSLLKEGEKYPLPLSNYAFFILHGQFEVIGNIYDNPELLKQE